MHQIKSCTCLTQVILPDDDDNIQKNRIEFQSIVEPNPYTRKNNLDCSRKTTKSPSNLEIFNFIIRKCAYKLVILYKSMLFVGMFWCIDYQVHSRELETDLNLMATYKSRGLSSIIFDVVRHHAWHASTEYQTMVFFQSQRLHWIVYLIESK